MVLVDPNTAIRSLICLSLDLHDLVSTDGNTRIYAGRAVPPPGYQIEDGPCVCFLVRGGAPDYDDALLEVSAQFKCYAESEAEAYAVYLALYGAIHNQSGGDVLKGLSEVAGQSLDEPDTEWPFVLAHFAFLIRQSQA